MKYYNYIYLFCKTIVNWWIIFLLLTHYNDLSIQSTTQMVESQLLNPFIIIKGQSLSFMRIIMVLGLSLISFLDSYSLIPEICKGFKQILEIHSKSKLDYRLSLIKLLTITYCKEYLLLFSGIVYVLLLLKCQFFNWEFLFFLIAWFIADIISYFLILYFVSEELLSIFLSCLAILFRYYFINHLFYVIGFLVLLYLLTLYLRRLTSARDNKWL
ncbi:hypothetical protein STRPS_1570 [Streptococcus pseudoporcinus LQ 940-04]|uniref:Uncharacterized protein n=1 Tax=Streptococcus pseudoporcinus LQ 940-04 TaxID=875093 RepID=G5KB51_9STRE|nr:hypothetical protein HMPREF9320_0198 [Streptococcus pseudoporcinus SPIN 20026]EHI65567.1 hypothetical protein STRPS_1570 [Streptococcus pseudoporcinus LQ 940-04]VEF94428.1 membrane protein [Streptococcus pseudoporcinus]